MDRIIEGISSTNQEYVSADDRITRAAASAVGAVCAGFSAGAAVQVHYGKYLPRPVKAMLVIPTAAASLAGVSMYRHGMKQDELNFIGGQPTPVVHTLSMPNTDLKLEKV